jgi:hypothetical protein
VAVAEEPSVEVVILQVFVSLMLVVGSVLLFGFTYRQHDLEHADRLALLPLESETHANTANASTSQKERTPAK